MADDDARSPDLPPLVILPRVHWRGVLVALVLLAIAAVVGAPIAALNALDAHDGQNALERQLDEQEEHLDDQRAQSEALQQQLDCRYVLSADVSRIQSDIFVTTALALAAAGRRDTAAVRLYTAHLDQLAEELDRASDDRADAVAICDTEPENVLG